MAQAHTPYSAVEIVLDKPRTLRLTFAAMVEIRNATGIDLLRGEAGEVDPYKLPEIVCALLRHEDRDIAVEDVSHMIDLNNITEVSAAVSQAFAVDLPDSKEAPGRDAPLGGKKGSGKARRS